MAKRKEAIDKLEEITNVDPRGWTNTEWRLAVKAVLRDHESRIAALEQELRERRAGLPGYD